MSGDPRVIIVGAGAAGIAAASRLVEKGLQNILVLEAKNRIGGRIHTVPFCKYNKLNFVIKLIALGCFK